MHKDLQTPELKEKLYALTLNFVRKYQPQYYRQYQGSLNDLASEIFCQFLTEKGRGEEKESLLDKYDPTLCPKALTLDVFFANLVKVSVVRKLIDFSRQDPIPAVSLDAALEALGDSVYSALPAYLPDRSECAVSGDIPKNADGSVSPDDIPIADYYPILLKRLSSLKASQVIAIKSYYTEVRNVISPEFRKVYDALLYPVLYISTSVGELPIYQLTPKSVILCYHNSFLVFDRFTGLGRSNSLVITPSGVSRLASLKVHKSPLSKEEFASSYNKL